MLDPILSNIDFTLFYKILYVYTHGVVWKKMEENCYVFI